MSEIAGSCAASAGDGAARVRLAQQMAIPCSATQTLARDRPVSPNALRIHPLPPLATPCRLSWRTSIEGPDHSSGAQRPTSLSERLCCSYWTELCRASVSDGVQDALQLCSRPHRRPLLARKGQGPPPGHPPWQHHRARHSRPHPHRRLPRVCLPPPYRPLPIRHVCHPLPGQPHGLGRRLLCTPRSVVACGACRARILIAVAAGYYTDSILKFRLTFPSNYPERPPVVQFLTDVFHPLISQQDGTFNLAPRFRPWRCVPGFSLCTPTHIGPQAERTPRLRRPPLGQGRFQEARA